MIYLCAGMYRSGSTWLYNAIRITLQEAGLPDVAAGWVGEKDKLIQHQHAVLKVHAFDAELAKKADIIFTSHRDLRDVVASLARRDNAAPSVEAARNTLRDYQAWAKVAVYDMHYETMIQDRMAELKRVAGLLRLPPERVANLDYAGILQKVEGEKYLEPRAVKKQYDAVNLLHQRHITDGRFGSWKEFLPETVSKQIESEFGPWLTANGYPLS